MLTVDQDVDVNREHFREASTHWHQIWQSQAVDPHVIGLLLN